MAQGEVKTNDWQINKSVVECNEFMFINQVSCDVHFRIKQANGVTVETSAHKYVLISRSPVFYALFCGELSTSDTVDIVDCEPVAFKLMLRYMYTEKIDLNADVVMAVMYAAKKYLLLSLVAQCKQFLATCINKDSVCVIFEQSLLFSEDDLQKNCLTFIEDNIEDIILSEHFHNLSSEAVSRIIKSDSLDAPELKVFQACVTWANSEAERQDVLPTPDNLRLVLGDILFQVRFPSMTAEDFANTVGSTGVLTKDEIAEIFMYKFSQKKQSIRFPTNERQSRKPQTCPLTTGPGTSIAITTGNKYSTTLSCNKPIHLLGVKVLTTQDSGNISNVNISINQNRNELHTTTVSSQDKAFVTSDKNILDITFLVPIKVDKGQFVISVTYNPNAYYGTSVTMVGSTYVKVASSLHGVAFGKISGEPVLNAIKYIYKRRDSDSNT